MANNQTIFQRLGSMFGGNNRDRVSQDIITTPSHARAENRVLFTTNDKEEYERKLKSYQQQKYLAHQWQKANYDNALENLAGYTAVKLMYRDVDLMDGCPEIGTALDIISEESCPLTSKGKMINIYSSSKRTKAMLEDLFTNRLHCYTDLPMIARHLVKYGNTYMMLNIDKDNGIMGWTMLPVYEIDRIEINDVEKETYYATLFLSKGDETLEIDARPSDAIAVAMRAEAPIYVTANVLMNGSVSTDSAKDEEEAEEFKNFIQSIKPSDFEKLMKGKHEETDQ
jgi:hypothetical protein